MNESGTIYVRSKTETPSLEADKLNAFASVVPTPIYTVRGVFPFDFLPNEITIFRNKVSVNRRHFPWMAEVTNIPLENINYVTVHASLMFATLEISDIYFTEQPQFISKLWKQDAFRALQVIDGLRLAIKQKIDLTKIPDHEILDEVLKIGAHAESEDVKARQQQSD